MARKEQGRRPLIEIAAEERRIGGQRPVVASMLEGLGPDDRAELVAFLMEPGYSCPTISRTIERAFGRKISAGAIRAWREAHGVR